MQGDKRKNAKGCYVPVQIREEENEELQEKETYRGTDRYRPMKNRRKRRNKKD
jgi:hypothetical protein